MGRQYGVIGLSHRTAPLAVRERLALSDDQLQSALVEIRGATAEECVILSTCNRVEIYAVAESNSAAKRILDIVGQTAQLEPGVLDPDEHLYNLWGDPAIRHLFRVASSLDSMVLGEPQILGQLKSAYQAAVEAGSVGGHLSRAMHRAFGTAKRVRTETKVGEGGVSISYVAAQLAAKIFGNLSGKSVLLVGAGEMAELAARNLAAHGASRVAIANRSIDRAKALADALGGEPRRLEQLPELLLAADIVITSTGSRDPILLRKTLAGIMRARKFRPLFLIDIAVPRDVEPAASELDNVYLYDVDDLQHVVADNERERNKEAYRAEAIVDEELHRFREWMEQTDIVPTIVALRQRLDGIREAELARFGSKLAHLEPKDIAVIESLLRAVTNKVAHSPTVALKRRAAEGLATQDVIDLVQDVFAISTTEQPPDE